MGAATFTQYEQGIEAGPAFARATAEAAYMHGHGGYSGTLAEKYNYVVIDHAPRPLGDAHVEADRLINEADERIDEKWGPAGALRVMDETHDGWLFFGWSSC
mgnify:CR=1 FL=1